MSNKFNIIEIVEASAISTNPIYPKDTLITFYNDTSKIKIADGKTEFNSLGSIGGAVSGISPETQAALNTKLTATKGAAVVNAVDTTDIVAKFNALLTSLRAANIINP